MRGVCGQIVAFFVWFGMRYASQPTVGEHRVSDRPVDCGREPLGGLRCGEPVGSSDNGKKDVVQKTDSCGRLSTHRGKMAECTKELVKTHVNIDFGSFLSRRMKYTFADSARRARHSESRNDCHRGWHPTRQRS